MYVNGITKANVLRCSQNPAQTMPSHVCNIEAHSESAYRIKKSVYRPLAFSFNIDVCSRAHAVTSTHKICMFKQSKQLWSEK